MGCVGLGCVADLGCVVGVVPPAAAEGLGFARLLPSPGEVADAGLAVDGFVEPVAGVKGLAVVVATPPESFTPVEAVVVVAAVVGPGFVVAVVCGNFVAGVGEALFAAGTIEFVAVAVREVPPTLGADIERVGF